jgi:hypothetical protein
MGSTGSGTLDFRFALTVWARLAWSASGIGAAMRVLVLLL